MMPLAQRGLRRSIILAGLLGCTLFVQFGWSLGNVSNGGFETWIGDLPSGWSSVGNSSSLSRSMDSNTGNYSVKVYPTAAFDGIRQGGISASNATQKRLRLSCWVKDADPDIEPASGQEYLRLMLVQWTPSGGVFNIEESSMIGSDLPDQWRKLVLNVGLSENQINSFEIQIGLYQSEGFEFLVDDVMLEVFDPLDVQDEQPSINSIAFYSPLYIEQSCLRQSDFGTAQSIRFCADVTGDGKDDAIIYEVDSGAWDVAICDKGVFGNGQQWRSFLGDGTPLMGDVNGDGKADAVIVDKLSGVWQVALSNGQTFGTPVSSQLSSCEALDTVLLGDLNGDGRADAVCFKQADAAWEVGLSQGNSFSTFTSWVVGHGLGSSQQMLADVNGDGLEDAVVFFDTSGLEGCWYVAPSNGSSYPGYQLWKSGCGSGSENQFLYDVNRDGKADAVYQKDGDWWVAYSANNTFGSATQWLLRFLTHPSITTQPDYFLGCLDGLLTHAVAVTDNIWYALSNSNYNYPKDSYTESSWACFGADQFPSWNGSGGRYDCMDGVLIWRHIKMLHDAGFNVVMFDHTNSVTLDWVTQRVNLVVELIDLWNANIPVGGHKMYYCLSIGAWRTDPHDPEIFESEAKFVFDNYSAWSENYYRVDGKPLLVNFSWTPERVALWEASTGDKTSTNRFTIRWMYNNVLNSEEYSNSYGWPIPEEYGNPVGDEVMDVMPGFNNFSGGYVVERNTGQFYRSQWYRVLLYKPRSVFLNSFNEFFERTGVEPAWSPVDEWQWKDYYGDRCDDFYWNMTRQYTQIYQNNVLLSGTYLQEYGHAEVYKVLEDGSFEHQMAMPHQRPVLLVPDGFRASFSGSVIEDEPYTASESWMFYQ